MSTPTGRASSIGRAGANLVLFAAIVNDLHRAAGRSGVGAVLGSKILKAVVRGTRGVGNVADRQAFMAAVTAGKQVLADNALTGQGLPTYGTQVLMNVINQMGASPTRKHRAVQFERARRIPAEAMHETEFERQLQPLLAGSAVDRLPGWVAVSSGTGSEPFLPRSVRRPRRPACGAAQ